MRALLFFLLLLIAPPLLATQQVARSGDQELHLLDTQCSHAGTLVHIKPEWRAEFKNARLLNKGTISFYGCWILADENTVFVIFEDGDAIDAPKKIFETVGT
jgi:hypothetical protein